MSPHAAQLISQVYVGYFNRAPDAAGLNYWVGRYNAGMKLGDIAQSFSVQTESTNTYAYLANPNVASVSTFLTSVYANLFNRAPDAAGLAYWTGEINAGRSNVGNAIINIISGAVDTPASGSTAATLDFTTLTNKMTAGLTWATAMANVAGATYTSAAAASAKAVVSGVTSDAATVTTAATATTSFFANGGGITGATFSGTVGLDSFAGTGSFNFVDIAGASTWTAGDAVTATGANNSLNVVTGNAIAAAPAGTVVSGVQTANLTSGSTIGNTTAINTSSWAGLNSLNLTGVGTIAATAASSTAINVNDSSFAATTMAINGGGNVSIIATGGTTGGTLNVGQTTANTGATNIALTSSTTAATGAVINAKGGTTVTISDTMTNTASGAGVQAVIGAIGVTGTSSTTAVSVSQSGGVTGANAVGAVANTSNVVAATKGVTNASVTISDANANSLTAAATISSVTLQNYGASTISSNALTSLTLSSTGTDASGTLGLTSGLTTGNPTTMALNLGGGSLGIITDSSNKLATWNASLSANTTLGGIADTAMRTLALSGTGVLTISDTTQTGTAALTSITETGAAGLKAILSTITGVTSLDASASTGTNTLTLNAATQAYKGGTGRSVITIAADATKVITGGSGTTDQIILTSDGSSYTTTNTKVNVTGFEQLGISNSGAAAGVSYDLSKFASGINLIEVVTVNTTGGGTGYTQTLTNVALGTALQLDVDSSGTGNGICYQLSDTNGANDSVSVNLKGVSVSAANGGGTYGYTTNVLTLQDANTVGIGTVNINSDASVFQGLHTIVTLSDPNLSNLNITGTGSLTITNQTTASTSLSISDNGTGTSATADGIGTLTASSNTLGTINYSGSHAFTIGTLADTVANLTITNTNTGTSGVLTVSGHTDANLAGLTLNGSVALTGTYTLTGAASVNGSTDNSAVSLTMSGGGVKTVSLGNGGNTIVTGAAADVITLGTGANTVTAGAGADKITFGAHTGVDKIIQSAAGDSGTFTTPASNTISTSSFDIVTGLKTGDTVKLSAYNIGGLTAATTGNLSTANATAASTLVVLGTTDNADYFVRGTFDATGKTFVGSATGADTLFVYDGNAASGTTAQEAVVLVGYVAPSVTSVNATLGVVTLS